MTDGLILYGIKTVFGRTQDVQNIALGAGHRPFNRGFLNLIAECGLLAKHVVCYTYVGPGGAIIRV